MKTIVMDSANKYLVVALYENQKCLASLQEEGNRKQSENAIVYLQKLLQENYLKMSDFDEMVITIGPGSYTGVRVALTIAKTLNATMNIKVKTVSSLKAMAGMKKAISILDARSHKLFLGIYNEGKVIVDDCLINIDEFENYQKQYSDYEIVGDTHLVGIPEKETDEENISSEALISLDNLDDFGFFIGINSKEREAGIKELKRVLIKYNITSNEEIAFFMGEVAKESNFGTRTVEMFSGDDPEEYFNNRYSNNSGLGNKGGNDGELYRGAGYIHLTGRYNYEKFAEYIEDDEIVTRGYKVVGGEYNKDVSDIEPGEVGVIDIGEYAWESAGWFWTEGNPKGCNLNDFVAKLDWKSVSEAINKGDKGTFVERNGYINDFYEILTGKSLGLPDSLE